ncbi:MAG: multicopper oxidase domain-containing protein [Gammaproteobacteria bacterium]|nr:multicopper oxidase domain-containing protein [Gammaproteobacteria bacterium]NIN60921.1 multicopper oxidase domain-containing protein [Gammaproteobacteria bacterium]NIO62545.1 multicopper oxidase domain-containing protein [Gammaproteobacteria bacterium]NIP49538.1 multicopper oxidase domain-containing protein [Gammaproteobacteria bacterium]NIQ10762.1 multicopper oxidase domain-containing protein [Gammaproteobacteria bacterium]
MVLIVILYACTWSNVTGADSDKFRHNYITAEDMVREYALSSLNNPMMRIVADNPGEWMYHCHVNHHIKAA